MKSEKIYGKKIDFFQHKGIVLATYNNKKIGIFNTKKEAINKIKNDWSERGTW